MTRSLIDKMAEAFYTRYRRGSDPNYKPEINWQRLDAETLTPSEMRASMRAALAAAREPTEAMMAAWEKVGIDQDPRDYWPAGIDAALGEEATGGKTK